MATKQIKWNDGSSDYITLTYTGQGDGVVTADSPQNNSATARSKTITIKTTAGSPVVTSNFIIDQGACPFPIGDVRNYAYNGSYYTVELPAGQYKLQVWGAQGGSNAAASTYSITAQAGGKGGYSEGVLTLASKTTIRVYVGGAGSSSSGGYNGGGSTSGFSSYSSGDTYGTSRMGGGGGATDIRLSDGALLSRMIVAGGGSGGAMCYKKETTTTTTTITDASGTAPEKHINRDVLICTIPVTPGVTYTLTKNVSGGTGWRPQSVAIFKWTNTSVWNEGANIVKTTNNVSSDTAPTGATYLHILDWCNSSDASVYNSYNSYTYKVTHQETQTSTNTDYDSHVGYVGGGTNGGGYSSSYYGKQNAAGSGGSFGQGASQTTTNYRFCSGAGGGGWYGGGGGRRSDSDMSYCKQSGGGSGFVNTAANASYRPSGYTGKQLDSGTTYAGNQSFPSPSGGNETGHAGNGYARITRLS